MGTYRLDAGGLFYCSFRDTESSTLVCDVCHDGGPSLDGISVGRRQRCPSTSATTSTPASGSWLFGCTWKSRYSETSQKLFWVLSRGNASRPGDGLAIAAGATTFVRPALCKERPKAPRSAEWEEAGAFEAGERWGPCSRVEASLLPPTSLRTRSAMSYRVFARAANSWLAAALFSALAALRWVAPSIRVTAGAICAMPRDCSWLPTSTRSPRTFTWVALPVTCWMQPAMSCSFLSLSVSLAIDSSIKAAVSLAVSATRCARLHTSPETRANPIPASPALAASTAAFSARMLV